MWGADDIKIIFDRRVRPLLVLYGTINVNLLL